MTLFESGRNRSLSIGMILLLIGLAFTPNIYAYAGKEKLDDFTIMNRDLENANYLIFGTGDISWLRIENKSWCFGGYYRKIYWTNLIIGNGPGMLPLDYCLFIKNLETGEILSKDSLPRQIYLNDFLGYLRANYYCFSPHGPTGFYITIFGFVENYYNWEY